MRKRGLSHQKGIHENSLWFVVAWPVARQGKRLYSTGVCGAVGRRVSRRAGEWDFCRAFQRSDKKRECFRRETKIRGSARSSRSWPRFCFAARTIDGLWRESATRTGPPYRSSSVHLSFPAACERSRYQLSAEEAPRTGHRAGNARTRTIWSRFIDPSHRLRRYLCWHARSYYVKLIS